MAKKQSSSEKILDYLVYQMKNFKNDKNWQTLNDAALLRFSDINYLLHRKNINYGYSPYLFRGRNSLPASTITTLDHLAHGAWDYKKILKDNNTISERYWLKKPNAKGEHGTVIGFSFPGHPNKIFDYDITGNIWWGYVTRATGPSWLPNWLLPPKYWAGLIGNYFDNNAKHLSEQERAIDYAKIKFGAYLYEQYGDNITPEILQREILAHADELNFHNRADLQEKFHIVQQGDTLFDIAKQNGVSVEQLVKLNPNLRDPNQLPIGQKIILPAPSDVVPNKNELKKYKKANNLSPAAIQQVYEKIYDNQPENNQEQYTIALLQNGNDDTATGTSYYIWRTAGDGRVRPLHHDYEGHIFSWQTPPADGHPGDAHGCRCRAVPFNPSDILYTTARESEYSYRQPYRRRVA